MAIHKNFQIKKNMVYIKSAVLFLILFFTVFVFPIISKVQTLNFRVKSLSLITDKLLSQNIDIISRVSKIQRDMDEFAITLNAHSAFPMNFSIDAIYLLNIAFIFLLSSYVIWTYAPAWTFLKTSLSFFTDRNDFLVRFRDFNENLYTIKYDQKSRMLDIFIKTINSGETYRLDDFLKLYRSHAGVLGEIKSRLVETVTQGTQTEAISDLTGEIQAQAVTLIPRIMSEPPISAQSITLTSEEIANLVTSLSSMF